MKKRFFYTFFGMLLIEHFVTANTADWTGFYIGGQAGAASSFAKWEYLNLNPYDSIGPDEPVIATVNKFRSSGGVGGGQVGFNYQFCNFVASIEAGCTNGGLSEKKLNVVQSTFPPSKQTVRSEISVLFIGAARLGYLFDEDWLVYTKAGYAGANVKTSGATKPWVIGFILDWDTSKWQNGWIVGTGVETRLYETVTLGLEYNYLSLMNSIHLGSVYGGTIDEKQQIRHRVNTHVQSVVVRLNFLIL